MKKLDDKAKKLLIVFGIAIGLILLIIFIVFIFYLIKNRSLEYTAIEDKMVDAAKDYYSSREDALPLNDEDEVEISSTLLAEEGYMKELSKYQKDDSVSCSGKVIVTKAGDVYNYSPYLNCGDKYTTTYLYEKLLETVVSKDDGLYKTSQYSKKNGSETAYIYKGDYVDNYLKIGDSLWRIVKIDKDYNFMLIQTQFDRKNGYRGSWDNRYNSSRNANVGINDYYKSIIRRGINDYYDTFSVDLKSKLILKDICVNTRSETDSKKDGSIECSKVLSEDYVSLLAVYDFMNASLDTNCNSTLNKSCSNYNYLVDYDRAFWLLTADKSKTYQGYKVDKDLYLTNLSTSGVARIVVNATKNLIYIGGSGTATDPYLVK